MASDTADLEILVGDLIAEVPVTYDPMTGTTQRWELDPATGVATQVTERDVGELVDENKYLFKEYDERTKWASDTHNHVATIPDFLFYDLWRKFGSPKDNPKAWMRWLDDPDNRAFRTRPGKLSR